MQTINLSSINMNFLESFTGSFSTIQKCEYDGKIYVYKKFDNINFFKKNMKKFQKLNEIDNDYLVMPAYFVFDDYEQVCITAVVDFVFDSSYLGCCFCGTERRNGLRWTVYF